MDPSCSRHVDAPAIRIVQGCHLTAGRWRQVLVPLAIVALQVGWTRGGEGQEEEIEYGVVV
jgi:hypothetical protein